MLNSSSIFSTEYLTAFGKVLERRELTDTSDGDAAIGD